MKIFFDTEFTGLFKKSRLISIGLVSEHGDKFYAEFNDYDAPGSEMDPWVEENTLPLLTLRDKDNYYSVEGEGWLVKWNAENVAEILTKWLKGFDEQLQMWSDCYAYDWVLFCDLFGGAMSVPECVHYIPMDLCTLMEANGIDPDISREGFAEMKGDKHNALFDAEVIKACHDKIVGRSE